MGKVLLGLAGPWADDSRESADHYTTKIGGLPDWPFPRESVSPNLFKCLKCGGQLCLVAQVYAPVSTGATKIEERLLLIFGCIMPGCETSPDSWRAFRVQRLGDGGEVTVSTPGKTMPSVSGSKTSWFDDLNDEDDDDDMDLEALGRALLEAGMALNSVSKKGVRNKRSGTVRNSIPSTPGTRLVDKESPVAPCFYIYTKEHKPASAAVSLSSNYSSLSIKEKQNADGGDDDSDKETWAPEAYEYDAALSADRTYLKFKKQLDANPEQCFRYCYGGKALVATQEVADIGGCKLCGGSRSYEMQLMPTVIYFLQEAADARLRSTSENWDWLTLLVYTCAQSCSNSNSSIDGWILAEESVVLQSENTKVLSQLSQFQ